MQKSLCTVQKIEEVILGVKTAIDNCAILKLVTGFDIMDAFNEIKQTLKSANIQVPVIIINAGEDMKLTRVLNTYLSPVCLSEPTGPGQMTKEDI